MMPVIRLSDRVWARLQAHAVPFEDKPEDVIRKALDALDHVKGTKAEVEKPKQPKARTRDGLLPQREFRMPLLRALEELGGSANLHEIRKLVLPKVEHRLSDADYEPVSSGDPRWWNATAWERSDLVRDGTLKDDSPRGTWELTDAAQKALKMTWKIGKDTAECSLGVASYYVDETGRFVSISTVRFTVEDPEISAETFAALAQDAIQRWEAPVR